MSSPMPSSCEDFDRDAAELALGHLGEPRRTELMDHAASCPTCDRVLADLITITDRMLELGPEIDPPPGFEEATVKRMSPARPAQRGMPRPLLVVLGSAFAIAVVVLWVAFITATPPDRLDGTRTATIVDRDGSPVGNVEIQLTTSPKLIVTIDGDDDWAGVWTCQLLADGDWVDVGRWTADDVTNGVWAAGLPPSLTDATAMRILGDSGGVIATADLPTTGDGT